MIQSTEPEYFFITSYGRTATVWLARALNMHPDMVCSHGPSLEPIILRQDVCYDERSILSSQDSLSQLSGVPLRRRIERLRANHKARWIGNIHAFTAKILEDKRVTESDVPAFRSINVLRHPITRIDSFWRRWKYEHTLRTPMTQWIQNEALSKARFRHIIEELQSLHDVELKEFSERAFFYAVMQTAADNGDLLTQAPHIISERLVADMDYFVYALELLTNGALHPTMEYLESIRQLGKQNMAEGGGKTSLQIFEEWAPWQRTLFSMFLRDHPLLQTRYPEFGYSLPKSCSDTDISKLPRSQLLNFFRFSRAAVPLRAAHHLIKNRVAASL